jgi:hypothetical protein
MQEDRDEFVVARFERRVGVDVEHLDGHAEVGQPMFRALLPSPVQR